MMAPPPGMPPNQNVAFADRVVQWLRGPTERSKCLFIENGVPRTDFDVVRYEALQGMPPLPVPPMPDPLDPELQRKLTDAINRGIANWQDDDRPNQIVAGTDERFNRVLRFLAAVAAVVLLVLLVRRAWRGRHEPDVPPVPTDTGRVAGTAPPGSLARRREEILQAGDYGGVVREYLRELFASQGLPEAAVQPRQVARGPGHGAGEHDSAGRPSYPVGCSLRPAPATGHVHPVEGAGADDRRRQAGGRGGPLAVRGHRRRSMSRPLTAAPVAAPVGEDIRPAQELAKQASELGRQVKDQVATVVVGADAVTEQLLIALLAGGHVLLEGVPGVAKTTLSKVFARLLGCQYQRVQFTPDLLPSDVTGTSIFDRNANDFVLRKGPIFTPGAAGRRDQPRPGQDAGGAARSDAGVPGDGGRADDPAAAAVHGAGDAEPGRAGGRLPAAGGAARPLPAAGRDGLPRLRARGQPAQAAQPAAGRRRRRCSPRS